MSTAAAHKIDLEFFFLFDSGKVTSGVLMSTGRAWKDSVFQVASKILVFPSTRARPLPASAPNENKNDADSESV